MDLIVNLGQYTGTIFHRICILSQRLLPRFPFCSFGIFGIFGMVLYPCVLLHRRDQRSRLRKGEGVLLKLLRCKGNSQIFFYHCSCWLLIYHVIRTCATTNLHLWPTFQVHIKEIKDEGRKKLCHRYQSSDKNVQDLI